MGLNILACDVRAILLVSIALSVEDQAKLLTLNASSISLRSQEEAQLQRHIEAGQHRSRIRLGARDVVNTQPTLGDYLSDLIEPDLAGIFDLKSTSCHEAAIVRSEYQRLENRPVFRVEWAVDEDVVAILGCRQERSVFVLRIRIAFDSPTLRLTGRRFAKPCPFLPNFSPRVCWPAPFATAHCQPPIWTCCWCVRLEVSLMQPSQR